jgi:hypothetical protein
VQLKNSAAQNARYALDYKQKAEEMSIPDEKIQSNISKFQI